MEPKKRIIITEDDPAMQDVFKLIFENAGYEAMIYPDGNELLNNEFQVPHLFILDKQLPGVSGLDICRHLKAQERSRAVPVIMLSATPHIEALSKAAGADDFMEKPFKIKELLNKAQQYIR